MPIIPQFHSLLINTIISNQSFRGLLDVWKHDFTFGIQSFGAVVSDVKT